MLAAQVTAVRTSFRKLRREAVRRSPGAEGAAAIATELRRSRRWVVKWLARYDPHDEAWEFSVIAIKYGATTLYGEGTGSITLLATARGRSLEFILAADNATSAQK